MVISPRIIVVRFLRIPKATYTMGSALWFGGSAPTMSMQVTSTSSSGVDEIG